MTMKNTTPIPNVVLDVYYPHLSHPERDVLLMIFRQTFGWKDENTTSTRKELDRISHRQFRSKTNLSRRAITSAIGSLVHMRLIEVLDERGNILASPAMRKGKHLLFYRPALAFFAGEKPVDMPDAGARNAQKLRTMCAGLAQQMRITK